MAWGLVAWSIAFGGGVFVFLTLFGALIFAVPSSARRRRWQVACLIAAWGIVFGGAIILLMFLRKSLFVDETRIVAAAFAMPRGLIGTVYSAWLAALILPPLALRRRLAKAGFDRRAIGHASWLASVVHGPVVLFWRAPRAEAFDGVPVDPSWHGWSFVRLLHQYQFSGRMVSGASEHPALEAGGRGRSGRMCAYGFVLVLSAFTLAAGLSDWPDRAEAGRHGRALRGVAAQRDSFPAIDNARQSGDHEEVLRWTGRKLPRHPESRYFLRAAAQSSAELGRFEDARDYTLRLVAVDQQRVELLGPRVDPPRRDGLWNSLRSSILWLKHYESRIEGAP